MELRHNFVEKKQLKSMHKFFSCCCIFHAGVGMNIELILNSTGFSGNIKKSFWFHMYSNFVLSHQKLYCHLLIETSVLLWWQESDFYILLII